MTVASALPAQAGGDGGAGKVKFDRLSLKNFSDPATTGILLPLAVPATTR